MLLAAQHQLWIIPLVVIVAIPIAYVLDRAIVARYRTAKEGQLPSRLSSLVFVLGIWLSISALVLMLVIYPNLWWLWVVVFLVVGYAIIAAVIVRKAGGSRRNPSA